LAKTVPDTFVFPQANRHHPGRNAQGCVIAPLQGEEGARIPVCTPGNVAHCSRNLPEICWVNAVFARPQARYEHAQIYQRRVAAANKALTDARLLDTTVAWSPSRSSVRLRTSNRLR